MIAFGSYNELKNNCVKDTVYLSIANLLTSLYTAIVVFCVIGFMGHQTYMDCLNNDYQTLMTSYPHKYGSLEELKTNIKLDEYIFWMEHQFHHSEFPLLANASRYCNYKDIIASVRF